MDGKPAVDASISDKNWVIKTFSVDQFHIGSVAFDERLKTITHFNFEHAI
jgi:hypothetical protein